MICRLVAQNIYEDLVLQLKTGFVHISNKFPNVKIWSFSILNWASDWGMNYFLRYYNQYKNDMKRTGVKFNRKRCIQFCARNAENITYSLREILLLSIWNCNFWNNDGLICFRSTLKIRFYQPMILTLRVLYHCFFQILNTKFLSL